MVANTNILNYFLSVVWTIQTTFSCGLTVSAPHAGRQAGRPAVCASRLGGFAAGLFMALDYWHHSLTALARIAEYLLVLD